MNDNDQPDLATEVADLLYSMSEALSQALPFVQRQKTGGRHEQDRLDAEKWLHKYEEIATRVYEAVNHKEAL